MNSLQRHPAHSPRVTRQCMFQADGEFARVGAFDEAGVLSVVWSGVGTVWVLW